MAKSSWQRILVPIVGSPVLVAALLFAVWVSPASAHEPAREAAVSTFARPHVARSGTTSGQHGYWLVGSDGGVFSFGSAPFFGSAANLHLQSPVVGIAPTPGRDGYWLVASDGGVFSFGAVSYTHLRAHETDSYLVCRLLLEKKKQTFHINIVLC